MCVKAENSMVTLFPDTFRVHYLLSGKQNVIPRTVTSPVLLPDTVPPDNLSGKRTDALHYLIDSYVLSLPYGYENISYATFIKVFSIVESGDTKQLLHNFLTHKH